MKAMYTLLFSISLISAGAIVEATPWMKNQNISADVDSSSMPKAMVPKSEVPMQSLGSQNGKQQSQTATVVEIISSDPSFSTLTKALKSTGLSEALSESGPFTIFAPNDQAFAKLSPNALEDLMNNKERLIAVLTYHVVPQKVTSDKLKAGKLKTLQGKPLNINVKDNNVTVNYSKVLNKDKQASNGVIHEIDTVLLP